VRPERFQLRPEPTLTAAHFARPGLPLDSNRIRAMSAVHSKQHPLCSPSTPFRVGSIDAGGLPTSRDQDFQWIQTGSGQRQHHNQSIAPSAHHTHLSSDLSLLRLPFIVDCTFVYRMPLCFIIVYVLCFQSNPYCPETPIYSPILPRRRFMSPLAM